MPAAVGYFSMEFGVSEVLPNYSGGLGVLAGDHLKAASDLGVPLIGVGCSTARATSASPCPWTAGSSRPTPCSTRRACRCTCSDEVGTPVLVSVAMPGGRTLHAGSGSPRWAASRCCCSTRTSRRTRRTCAGSRTGSTAATRTTASARRSWSASAACAPCGRSAPPPGTPRRRSSTPTRATPATWASSASASCRSQGSASTRRWPPSAPARCSPPTPGARWHRPVPDRDGPPLLRRRGLGPLGAAARRVDRAGPRARLRGEPEHVQHGAHGPAPGPAGERRVQAARRGVRDMFGGLWSGFDPRGTDRLGHQRRARPHLGGPRGHRADRRPSPTDAVRRGDRRDQLWAARVAALAAGRRGPQAGPRGVAAARRLHPRAGLDRVRLRPGRAHGRFRPPGARPTSG